VNSELPPAKVSTRAERAAARAALHEASASISELPETESIPAEQADDTNQGLLAQPEYDWSHVNPGMFDASAFDLSDVPVPVGGDFTVWDHGTVSEFEQQLYGYQF